ncbi:MAG: hypothetical protein WC799_24650 [Desulfobacteraceae bacterium]|jgi:hypothetical protein
MKKFKINSNRSIGRVLFIVEGLRTEFYILKKIFAGLFDYTYEKLDRNNRYWKYTSKANPNSSVFAINPEESNLSHINSANEYLDNIFLSLIETYDFPVDKASIFYIFDRDPNSTKSSLTLELLNRLQNSRDNGMERQGLLLLSYPSIESYTASNFISESCGMSFQLGSELKKYLNHEKIIQNKIDHDSIIFATREMFNYFGKESIVFDSLDDFGKTNLQVFNVQEDFHQKNNAYRLLSLLSIAFLDLGLIEIYN